MISMEILDHSGSIWVTSFKETEAILGNTLATICFQHKVEILLSLRENHS